MWCLCVQHGESPVKPHHLEYAEGGILDMDDLLSDLVEDRDKVRTRQCFAVPCVEALLLPLLQHKRHLID